MNSNTAQEYPIQDWAQTAEQLAALFAERAAEHDANDTFVADN